MDRIWRASPLAQSLSDSALQTLMLRHGIRPRPSRCHCIARKYGGHQPKPNIKGAFAPREAPLCALCDGS